MRGSHALPGKRARASAELVERSEVARERGVALRGVLSAECKRGVEDAMDGEPKINDVASDLCARSERPKSSLQSRTVDASCSASRCICTPRSSEVCSRSAFTRVRGDLVHQVGLKLTGEHLQRRIMLL